MKKPSAEGGSEGCAQAAVTGRGRETQSQWAEERAGKHIVTKADKVACTASQFRGGGERKAPKRPCHCWSGRPGGWEGEELGVGRVEFESPWMGEKLDVWIWGSEMFVLEVVAVRRSGDRVEGQSRSPLRGRLGGGSSVGPWAASPLATAWGHGKAPTGRSTDICHPGRERVLVGGESPVGSMAEGSRRPGTPGWVDNFLEWTLPVNRRKPSAKRGPGRLLAGQRRLVSLLWELHDQGLCNWS